MAALLTGIACIAVAVAMLRFRRIDNSWVSVLPARRWYRRFNFYGGPVLLIVFGVALVISGIVSFSN